MRSHRIKWPSIRSVASRFLWKASHRAPDLQWWMYSALFSTHHMSVIFFHTQFCSVWFCSPHCVLAPSLSQHVIGLRGSHGSLLKKRWDIRGEDGNRSRLERGRGDANAAAAAETVKVMHEHYSRVGQREAASHTVAQLRRMMGFQSYWGRLWSGIHAVGLKLNKSKSLIFTSIVVLLLCRSLCLHCKKCLAFSAYFSNKNIFVRLQWKVMFLQHRTLQTNNSLMLTGSCS